MVAAQAEYGRAGVAYDLAKRSYLAGGNTSVHTAPNANADRSRVQDRTVIPPVQHPISSAPAHQPEPPPVVRTDYGPCSTGY